MKLLTSLSLSMVGDEIYWVKGRQTRSKILLKSSGNQLLNKNRPIAYSELLGLEKLKLVRFILSLDEDFYSLDYLKLEGLDRGEIRKYLKDNYRDVEGELIQYIISLPAYKDYVSILVARLGQASLEEISDFYSKFFLRFKAIGINAYNLVKLIKFSGLINDQYKTNDKVLMNINLSYDYIDSLIFKDMDISYNSRIKSGLGDLFTQEDFKEEASKISNVFHLDLEEAFHKKILIYLDRLVQHITITMDYYNTKFDQEIAYIFLSGPGSSLAGIDNFLTSNLDKQTIVLRQLDKVDLVENLNLYPYALGGLIQGGEVNYV